MYIYFPLQIDIDRVPNNRVSWIALPTAVDYVMQHVQSSPLSYINFKPFLLSLGTRHQSARFLSLLLDHGIDSLIDASGEDKEDVFFKLIHYALQQPANINLYLRDEEVWPGRTEAELLDRVLNFVDTGLANDIAGLQD
jgi:hypothetical protein